MEEKKRLRSGIVRLVALGIGALLLSLPTLPAGQAEARELKMAFFTGARHPIPRFMMIPWGKDLTNAGLGLEVRAFPGGQIGGAPPGAFKRVVNGISDIEWHLPGYTSSVFPRTMVMEIPLQWGSPTEATRALWKIYDRHLSSEYKRVKLLALWATDVPVVMTNKLVRHPDDLKGLKIRTPSANQAAIIKGLGAIPVAMPMPQTYGALEKGVVDGAIVGISVVGSFKLAEVVKNFIVDLPFGYSPMMVAMNLKTYRSLNARQKAYVDANSGLKWSLKGATIYEGARKRFIKVVRERPDTKIIELTAAERAAWVKKLRKVVSAWVDTFEAKGLPYRQILNAYYPPGQ